MHDDVLFFDYWTRGIHNFIPVAERLRELGITSRLLHLGSWRDLSVPNHETLAGMECHDIRLYGGSIARALKALNPKVLVTLNSTMTMDRTVVRLCRSMNIRTLYLMHGIHAIGADLDEVVAQQNAHWTVAKRIGKIGKYTDICLGYLGAVARDQPLEIFDPRTYAHFIQMALWPGASHARPWRHKDVYCDLALVYANAYRDSMIKEVGYAPERVRVVGNPNLDAVYALARDSEARNRARTRIESLGVSPGREAVVYMEDAFPEQGIGSWTELTRITELNEIADAVNAAGYDLIVKMHPGSNSSAVIAAFLDHPAVHVVLKTDLSELILGCAATIGHTSTTLLLPIVFGRPLFVPTWSPGLERFGYYVSAKAAIPAASPPELTALLREVGNRAGSSASQLDQFIGEYITHTDGCSLDRIVDEIVACAAS